MVIVTVKQCLQQLNDDIKMKILRKQNESMKEVNSNDLSFRLQNNNFRKKLLATCSTIEKKYLILFFQKYNAYLKCSDKEEQTTEEKLALLLLRQKGIIFKIEFNHKQRYAIPIEFMESFFEDSFQHNQKAVASQVLATKKYIYFIIELLRYTEEKKVKTLTDLHLLNEKVAQIIDIDWPLLASFLEEEGCLKTNKQGLLSINKKNCTQFFMEDNEDVKRRLSRFIIFTLIKDPFIAEFLHWVIFRYCGDNSVSYDDLELYAQKNQLSMNGDFFMAVEQLQLFEIISFKENKLMLTCDSIDEENSIGIENGILHFLIPVYISNDALWSFACWGNFQQWESMVEIRISIDTVRAALREGYEFTTLIENLQKYIPHNLIVNWQQTLQQWLDSAKPVEKKDNIIFYTITEKLHKAYIEEGWTDWIQFSNQGLLIEKEMEVKFEKLLKQIPINLAERHIEDEVGKEEQSLIVINEFPDISTIFPEIEKIPKQWFALTSYEEKAMQRIVKQATVLQLPLQIEKKNGDIKKVSTTKLIVHNGNFEIEIAHENNISFQEIQRLAIVHPLQNIKE